MPESEALSDSGEGRSRGRVDLGAAVRPPVCVHRLGRRGRAVVTQNEVQG